MGAGVFHAIALYEIVFFGRLRQRGATSESSVFRLGGA
jgi:hypothetical protein